MAFLIDEQQGIEENIFKYEQRLGSEYSKYLDKSPIFTTYYHINVNETTVDDGFRDIESIIGNRSALRFQKIENFPIYGLDSVILNIQEGDQGQGLDTEFTSEAIILPNTIKPLQNDFFMINHVKEAYLFRITDVQYDSIRPDNFYKISYKFEYLDELYVEEIENQVEEKYSCILQNIGSENSCIIKEEYKDVIDKIDSMYNEMVSTYMAVYYNERYNCFLGDMGDGYKLYDPLQSEFINKHRLLNKKNSLNTVILSSEFEDNKRKIKYEKSIYRFIETQDLKRLSSFDYITFPGTIKQDSSFYRWRDSSIKISDIPSSIDTQYCNHLLSDEMILDIKMNAPDSTLNQYQSLIKIFCRKSLDSIMDIPLDLNDELIKYDGGIEVFFFTPILLYIIQTTVNNFIKIKK